jgi:dienelactone hydrolase
MRIFWLAGLVASLAAPAAAQQTPPEQWHTVLAPSPNIAIGKRTVTIPGEKGTSFQADVYAPAGTPRGAIVFISGTDNARAWGNYIDLAKLATEHGLIGIIPDKRWPRGGGSAAFETSHADTIALLKALGTGGEIGIGADRTCAWLFSGGGVQLAAVFDPAAPQLACTIGFYPYFGGPDGTPAEAWARTYQPLDAFRAHAATRRMPMLLVRAGKDSEGLNRRLGDFVGAALVANYDLRLINLPDAVHAFDLLDDTDWSRAALREAFDFAVTQTAR